LALQSIGTAEFTLLSTRQLLVKTRSNVRCGVRLEAWWLPSCWGIQLRPNRPACEPGPGCRRI